MKNNLSDMMCLDIYLSSLSDSTRDKIKLEIKPSTSKIMPLVSWDGYSEHYLKTLEISKIQSDIKMVKSFAQQAKWKNKIDVIFNSIEFEALIITDANQKILWVNNGFSEMTGYSKTYAMNKTPRFLQGTETSNETKTEIKKQLSNFETFTGTITNYRKDNTIYKCEVQIIPMYNQSVTHFLAIEKEI